MYLLTTAVTQFTLIPHVTNWGVMRNNKRENFSYLLVRETNIWKLLKWSMPDQEKIQCSSRGQVIRWVRVDKLNGELVTRSHEKYTLQYGTKNHNQTHYAIMQSLTQESETFGTDFNAGIALVRTHEDCKVKTSRTVWNELSWFLKQHKFCAKKQC